MTPLDTLIAAVKHHEHLVAMEWSKHHQPPNTELLDKNRAALRVTFEQVLADLQVADEETIEAVRTLRRQRDAALALNARLRDALQEALDEWEEATAYKGEYLTKKHGDVARITELSTLVRVPYGEQS